MSFYTQINSKPCLTPDKFIGLCNICAAVFAALATFAAMNSNSLAIAADAAGMIVGTLIGIPIWFALRASRRGNGLTYSYGGGKLESLSILLYGVAVLISAFGIAFISVNHLQHPQPLTGAGFGICVLVAGILCNGMLLRLASAIIRQETSRLLEAWITTQRIVIVQLTIVLTLVAISSAYAGTTSWVDRIDPTVGLMMALMMVRGITGRMRGSVLELVDRSLEEAEQMVINQVLARRFNDYDLLLTVRSRRSGNYAIIELGLGFFENRSWPEVASCCKRVTDELRMAFPGADVNVVPSVA